MIHKQDEDADLLLQEYIKTDYDARVLVLGGKILATMKRPVIEGDFRSNVSQGSKPQKLELTEFLRRMPKACTMEALRIF